MPRSGIDQEQLIEIITEVFIDKGSEGATLTELSRATGLKKASLYYHFPGGKKEIIETVVRFVISRLESEVFSHLNSDINASICLSRMVNGFDKYCDGGKKNCIFISLNSGNQARELRDGITGQFKVWIHLLTKTIANTGISMKRSERMASDVFSSLYGSLALSQLLDEPKIFRKTTKRLQKKIARL